MAKISCVNGKVVVGGKPLKHKGRAVSCTGNGSRFRTSLPGLKLLLKNKNASMKQLSSYWLKEQAQKLKARKSRKPGRPRKGGARKSKGRPRKSRKPGRPRKRKSKGRPRKRKSKGRPRKRKSKGRPRKSRKGKSKKGRK